MRGARTDMMTRDEKLARDLAGGQQERSHQQMGNMLELFDRYDAESKWRKKAIPGAPLPPWQNKSSVANSTASAAIREELWSNRKKIPSTAAAVVQQESHGDVLSPMLHNPNQLRHKQYHEYKTQTQKVDVMDFSTSTHNSIRRLHTAHTLILPPLRKTWGTQLVRGQSISNVRVGKRDEGATRAE